MRYLVDTCIWVDFLEDRKGHNGEPLGKYAAELFLKILKEGLVISDITLSELKNKYSDEKISSIMLPFKKKAVTIFATEDQFKRAITLSKRYAVPKGDALHAIVALDNNLMLITRDKHFKRLKNICKSYKPEELFKF